MNCPIFQPFKGENRQEHLVINDLLIHEIHENFHYMLYRCIPEAKVDEACH